ncbi:citrate/2-methylcitrate synthase [Pseudonocardia sp. CA-142604]|uniref:citrate/2-methylcitrate synthase n=1 Tax=Pseudonocardia sp. CA-142604 TaxID=3240024 RepID=UPI003D95045C
MSTSAGPRSDVISIAQAAGLLGVKPATVYAYISRGQLSSSRLPDDRRSWLSRTEVEEFARRRGARPLAAPLPLDLRLPEAASTAPAETSVGWIADDRLLFRGIDATELAVSVPYAEVAELLWTGVIAPGRLHRLDARLRRSIQRTQAAMPGSSLPLDRLKATAILLGATDPFRYDLSRPAVLSAARTLAPAFVESLPLLAATDATDGRDTDGRDTDGGDDLATRLWSRLTPARPRETQLALLSAALVLLAEHGLGPSTRAAREAAASAADPYSVVLAGMSVASGLLLGGGSSLAVQAWLEEIDTVAAVSRVLADRLLRGDKVSGFGQPRYRVPDPRAALLLELLAASHGDPERQRIVTAVVAAVRERRGLAPNAEFALGAMCFVHGMPRGAGEAVLVIARCAGWIAHAVEEYEATPGPHAPLSRT